MNAPKILTALALLGLGAATQAQTTQQAPATTIYVYMVAKVDAQHILLSEVMEANELSTREELMATLSASHPEVKIPDSTEGVRFASRAAAEKDLASMKARYAQAGKTVTLLGER